MKLILDCREKELIKQINQQVLFFPAFKKIEVVIENLPLGDIIILNDDGTNELIFERKTIPDLLSSITDGRYEEQSYRLNGLNHHNHNIIYIIEGDVNNNKQFKKIDKMTFFSALLSLNFYKGFSVMKTQNLTETATFLCNSLLKIQKTTTKTKYYDENTSGRPNKKTNITSSQFSTGPEMQNNDTLEVTTLSDEETQQEEKDYVHVVKKVKKENITRNNIDEIMLAQIPGISSIISIAIISKLGSIKNIVCKYNEVLNILSNDEEFKSKDDAFQQSRIVNTMFNDISYINSTGNKRKISKLATNNLYTFLLKSK